MIETVLVFLSGAALGFVAWALAWNSSSQDSDCPEERIQSSKEFLDTDPRYRITIWLTPSPHGPLVFDEVTFRRLGKFEKKVSLCKVKEKPSRKKKKKRDARKD